MAGWQSGYAAACKAVNAGSIPASASINNDLKGVEKQNSITEKYKYIKTIC